MADESPKVVPVLTPLVALLKSRKFWVAIGTLAVDLLIANVPSLESQRENLLLVVSAVGAVLVGAIAYEDANKM